MVLRQRPMLAALSQRDKTKVSLLIFLLSSNCVE